MKSHRPQIKWIETRAELRALTSPVRQEIVDVLASAGASSIAELAGYLGRPADALYFHVRQLLRAQLLIQCPPRKHGRHVAAMYDLAGRPLKIRYGKAPLAEVSRVLRAAIRLGTRDMDRALPEFGHLPIDDLRRLRAGRVKGWVSDKQLRRINALINELMDIVQKGTPSPRNGLQSFTFVLAPVAPKRRAVTRKKKGATT